SGMPTVGWKICWWLHLPYKTQKNRPLIQHNQENSIKNSLGNSIAPVLFFQEAASKNCPTCVSTPATALLTENALRQEEHGVFIITYDIIYFFPNYPPHFLSL
ncbi:MAG: hypothetical protein ACRCUY_08915, partial [Thermoguttaceae bacterium]